MIDKFFESVQKYLIGKSFLQKLYLHDFSGQALTERLRKKKHSESLAQ